MSSNYSGIDATDVSVINNENVGVLVTPTGGLTTTEIGNIAQFTAVLTSQPTDDVIIPILSSNISEGLINGLVNGYSTLIDHLMVYMWKICSLIQLLITTLLTSL